MKISIAVALCAVLAAGCAGSGQSPATPTIPPYSIQGNSIYVQGALAATTDFHRDGTVTVQLADGRTILDKPLAGHTVSAPRQTQSVVLQNATCRADQVGLDAAQRAYNTALAELIVGGGLLAFVEVDTLGIAALLGLGAAQALLAQHFLDAKNNLADAQNLFNADGC